MTRSVRSLLAGLTAMLVLVTAGAGTVRAADAAAVGADDLTSARTVIVRDLTIPVPGQEAVRAWLVRPAQPARAGAAGILWLHWLGEIHNDRSEFLAEAVSLAADGVVSILPQGTFPWVPDPVGDTSDVRAVRAQRDAFAAALRELRDRPGVDDSRIAIVGHDYGAMYGTLLADRERPVKALVAAAPDATWGNWFAQFWLGLEGRERAAYLALFRGLDPVDRIDRLGSHVLIQWAGDDFFIPEQVRDAFAASAPQAQTILYPGVDHEFTTQAEIDRRAFLTAELGLS